MDALAENAPLPDKSTADNTATDLILNKITFAVVYVLLLTPIFLSMIEIASTGVQNLYHPNNWVFGQKAGLAEGLAIPSPFCVIALFLLGSSRDNPLSGLKKLGLLVALFWVLLIAFIFIARPEFLETRIY